MKFHPLLVGSQVPQKGSGETGWKKSCWTWLAENTAPSLLPLIWHWSVCGIESQKTCPEVSMPVFMIFLSKEQVQPSVKMGCYGSEMLLQHYAVAREMGE